MKVIFWWQLNNLEKVEDALISPAGGADYERVRLGGTKWLLGFINECDCLRLIKIRVCLACVLGSAPSTSELRQCDVCDVEWWLSRIWDTRGGMGGEGGVQIQICPRRCEKPMCVPCIRAKFLLCFNVDGFAADAQHKIRSSKALLLETGRVTSMSTCYFGLQHRVQDSDLSFLSSSAHGKKVFHFSIMGPIERVQSCRSPSCLCHLNNLFGRSEWFWRMSVTHTNHNQLEQSHVWQDCVTLRINSILEIFHDHYFEITKIP